MAGAESLAGDAGGQRGEAPQRARGRRARGRGLFAAALAAVLLLAFAAPASAQQKPVGRFKSVQGSVSLVRGGTEQVAAAAMLVHESDEVITGATGRAGIGFDDQSVLALGPSSRFAIERYSDGASGAAPSRFETSLVRGTLAVVAGKIARSAADAMKVRTPNAVLGVRGTEFIVEVAGKP